MSYHRANKTQVTEMIFKMTQFVFQGFIRFPLICWNSVPFRENSIDHYTTDVSFAFTKLVITYRSSDGLWQISPFRTIGPLCNKVHSPLYCSYHPNFIHEDLGKDTSQWHMSEWTHQPSCKTTITWWLPLIPCKKSKRIQPHRVISSFECDIISEIIVLQEVA